MVWVNGILSDGVLGHNYMPCHQAAAEEWGTLISTIPATSLPVTTTVAPGTQQWRRPRSAQREVLFLVKVSSAVKVSSVERALIRIGFAP
jgi:hypothetical protein